MDYSAHDKINHDRIQSLGDDWARAGDRHIAGKPPLRVYFPQENDVAKLFGQLREERARMLSTTSGAELTVKFRGKGHSDNGLVTGDKDVVIVSTELLVDETLLKGKSEPKQAPGGGQWSVRVLAGTEVGVLDEALCKHDPPLGLSIMPDHGHISVGGIVSAGGLSAASHEYGLFVDTVLEIEVVNKYGNYNTFKRGDKDFNQKLMSVGQDGFIVAVVLDVQEINKDEALLKSNFEVFVVQSDPANQSFSFDDYVNGLLNLKSKLTPEVKYQRGLYVVSGRGRKGIVTWFTPASGARNQWKQRDQSISQLVEIGRLSGTLRPPLDRFEMALKEQGIMALQRPLPFSTHRDVERLAERVIDSTVGPGTVMYTILVPEELFAALFLQIATECDRLFGQGIFALYALYSRYINSTYLSGPDGVAHTYLDISILAAISPYKMPLTDPPQPRDDVQAVIDDLGKALDDMAANANNNGDVPPVFRYLTTRSQIDLTTKDNRNANSLWR